MPYSFRDSLTNIVLLHGRIVERDVFAAFGIFFGFQIAYLGFALGFGFFLCFWFPIHIGPSIDCCCLGRACSQVYCPKFDARLRGKWVKA